VGIVFQDLALWPHMTVRENVAFPLRGDRDRADAILDEVRIEEGRDRLPHQISGGEKRRVALGRALARDPQVILLDEPFSDMQRGLRDDLISLVRDIARRREVAVIHTTHSPEEALAFTDRIGVLQDGRIVQEGKPRQVYDHPVNPEVARLLGEMGVIRGARIDATHVRTSLGEVPVESGDGDVLLGIRPEAVRVGEEGSVAGRIHRIRYGGGRTLYEVEVDGDRIWGFGDGDHREGDAVRIRPDLSALRPLGEAP
jgi:iron(III) transport system ATP-binding protein